MFPHQRAAVEFLAGQGGRGLLADDMGLGKTATAVAFASGVGAQRVVIVAPLTALPFWRGQIERWGTGGEILGIRTSSLDSIPVNIRWLLVTYESLVRRSRPGKAALNSSRRPSPTCLAIKSWSPDTLILDEAHRAKNHDSRRTKSVSMLAEATPRVVLLTGTPVRNRPAEVLVLLSLLSAQSAAQIAAWGEQWARIPNDLLIEIAKTRLAVRMLRRTKQDALPDLPQLRHLWRPLPWAVTSATTALLREIDCELNSAAYATSEGEKHGAFARAVRKLGLAKAQSPALLEFLVQRQEKGLGTLLFARHLDVVAALDQRLRAAGIRTVVLTGKTPQAERAQLVAAFQSGGADVFIGTIGAAGESLTLTRADIAVFCELEWVPAALAQAAARGHRVGQKAPTYSAVYFHAPHAIDEVLMETNAQKLGYVGAILEDDAAIGLKEIIERVLRKSAQSRTRPAA